MPVVNIETAKNLFDAVEECLAKHGLNFVKVLYFMSDTTNVMKGVRTGVQKLNKDRNPFLYDAGCICHLADTVKAGMKAWPVDIDQLFIVIFSIAARENRNFMICGPLCMHLILRIS